MLGWRILLSGNRCRGRKGCEATAAISASMTISWTGSARASCWRRRSKGDGCPIADGSVVTAAAAVPADRRVRLSADHDDPARAGAVGGSASARQCAFPSGASISGGCRCDDAGQVFAEAACWGRGVIGQVEEVLQIGDQHGLAL